MALAFVNSNFALVNTAGTTVSIAWTPAQAGNLLIISYVDTLGSLSSPSIADTNTNSWLVSNPVTRNAGISVNAAQWYSICKAGATTITITVASCNFREVWISEWSGQSSISPLDQHSENASSGTAPTSLAKTTLFARELIYGFCISGPATLAAGAGFTPETNDGQGNVPESQIVSATGSNAAVWTLGTTGSYVALMSTFKEDIPIVGYLSTSQSNLTSFGD